jgi:hypothetical protein
MEYIPTQVGKTSSYGPGLAGMISAINQRFYPAPHASSYWPTTYDIPRIPMPGNAANQFSGSDQGSGMNAFSPEALAQFMQYPNEGWMQWLRNIRREGVPTAQGPGIQWGQGLLPTGGTTWGS